MMKKIMNRMKTITVVVMALTVMTTGTALAAPRPVPRHQEPVPAPAPAPKHIGKTEAFLTGVGIALGNAAIDSLTSD